MCPYRAASGGARHSLERRVPPIARSARLNPIQPQFLSPRKRPDEFLAASGSRNQLREHRSSGDQCAATESRIQCGWAARLSVASLSHNAMTTLVSMAVVIRPSSRGAIFQYSFCQTEFPGYQWHDILRRRSCFESVGRALTCRRSRTAVCLRFALLAFVVFPAVR